MDAPLKHSGICLSIRSIGGRFSSADHALELLRQLQPTRIDTKSPAQTRPGSTSTRTRRASYPTTAPSRW